MRICSKCKKNKQNDEFFKDKRTTSGFYSSCKSCHVLACKEYKKSWREKNRLKIRAYNKEYRILFFSRHPDYMREQYKKHRHKFDYRKYRYGTEQDFKYNARLTLRKAVKRGLIIKPVKCSIDNLDCKGRIEAHHEDYNKPLEVKWVCKRHHMDTHIKKNLEVFKKERI